MDDQLRRYYLAAAGILLATAAVSLALGSPRTAASSTAGVLVSVLPFATWHAIVGLAEKGGRRRAGLVVLIAVKYAAVAAVLWALFRFRFTEPPALGAGLVAGSLAILVVAFSGARK